MEIRTVALIGLGGLGIAFGQRMLENLPPGHLRVVADKQRIARYKGEGVTSNGKQLNFDYVTPEDVSSPADLALFMVKGPTLPGAIKAMKNQIGPSTFVLSALNGISSEQDIAAVYGRENLLCCVAQGMDVLRQGSHITFKSIGKLCFGELLPGRQGAQVAAVATLFGKANIPHEAVDDMAHKMWSKFMLNVGINQTAAATNGTYGSVIAPGPAFDTMIAAMREVQALARYEGVRLTDEDIDYWVGVIRSLDPNSCPSMQQDILAKRRTELDLFAGTVLRLADKYNIPSPVNKYLYKCISSLEKCFEEVSL